MQARRLSRSRWSAASCSSCERRFARWLRHMLIGRGIVPVWTAPRLIPKNVTAARAVAFAATIAPSTSLPFVSSFISNLFQPSGASVGHRPMMARCGRLMLFVCWRAMPQQLRHRTPHAVFGHNKTNLNLGRGFCSAFLSEQRFHALRLFEGGFAAFAASLLSLRFLARTFAAAGLTSGRGLTGARFRCLARS